MSPLGSVRGASADARASQPGAKAKPKAKPKAKATYTRARSYRELPVEGGPGIMRAEKGDYICLSASGAVKVKPPSVFALEGAK